MVHTIWGACQKRIHCRSMCWRTNKYRSESWTFVEIIFFFQHFVVRTCWKSCPKSIQTWKTRKKRLNKKSNFLSWWKIILKKSFWSKFHNLVRIWKILKFFFGKNFYNGFSEKYVFFRSKKKVEKIFDSLYRCKIFWRIHFSHL